MDIKPYRDRPHEDRPREGRTLGDDDTRQARHDRGRVLRALNASLAFVLVLAAAYVAQAYVDWGPWAIEPGTVQGLWAILTAPLLHGSLEHVAANATSLLILGTLAGSVYPRATLAALPLLWVGSGLGAWWLGSPGTHHLGASGLTHGLMFLVLGLGLLRRDRAAIATGMIAFLFYGSMLLTVLPREPGISWQAHLGGAVAGLLAAVLLRKRDPPLPRRRYSWEDEEDSAVPVDDELEPPAPRDVPVLWHRQDGVDTDRVVVPLRRRPPGGE